MGETIRRHVPAADVADMVLLPFSEALGQAMSPQPEYDVRQWLYVPPVYTEYRYILGTRGHKPLICVGINPSTARPDRLDPTLQSVQRIARRNGYDSFLMLNLCAQRATDPNDMTWRYPETLRQGNLDAMDYALSLSETPVIWAAWGTMIRKRPYLKDLLRGLAQIAETRAATWVTYGPRSRAGDPHHPLYLRADALAEPFDVNAYLMI